MAEVDKTGLDILCSFPGDVYVPPKNGISVCIHADGTILICDSKTDRCTRADLQSDDKHPSVESVMVHRLLKLVKALTERVERLEGQATGSTASS